MPTDYHEAVRDAVRTALAAVLNAVGVYPNLSVAALEDPDADLVAKNLPLVGVCCVGPEQDRPDFGTNARTGLGLPVAVALFTAGVTGGTRLTGVPSPTLFRRYVTTTFDRKRLAAVAEVGYCEVSDSGPLFDKDSPAFQKLSTAVVVTAVGRFPRS